MHAPAAGLVLASGSPYRQALLRKLGLPFETARPEVDENPLPGETPLQLAVRLAEAKARALRVRFPRHLIIGSDQVAIRGTRVLTKPGTFRNTVEQLKAASGRTLVFHTSVCLYDAASNRSLTDVDTCTVHLRELTESQIVHYVNKDSPFDCVGGFKSEALGIALMRRIEGEDPNALIGLPLIRLVRLLEQFGVHVL